MDKTLLLFCLDDRQSFVNDIINEINKIPIENNINLGNLKKYKFSDGEISLNYETSVRGKVIFLLSSPRTSEEIMYLNLAIDAAKRAGARQIIPILPYLPYSRQDKVDYIRGPIGAKIIAEMLEQRGATSVITYDLHADQIQGFFNIPITHIEGKHVFDDYIASITNEDTILCGPDAGSGKRVKRMKDQLMKKHNINLNYVMLDKTRKEANVIDEMVIIGDVTGKDVIILDDMVDTAGTLCKAAEVIMEAGAKSVRAIISHGVLSGPAYDRINESVLTELVISDSLSSSKLDKIRVISVAEEIAFAMTAISHNISYETLMTTQK